MNQYVESMTEAELQAVIVEAADLFGWAVFHDNDSRRNKPGFPDLVLVRPPTVLFIECKTAGGRVRTEQQQWLTVLDGCDRVRSGVIRPDQLDQIITTLRTDQ